VVVQSLASRILARFGQDIESATRPGESQSNEVWIAGDVVLRLGAEPGRGSLAFEARLANLLPPEVGYPRVLDSGFIEGHEYMVTSRLPGSNLESVWDEIGSAARVRAIEDLWARLEAVHRTPVDQARAIGATFTPFYSLDATAAGHQLERLLAEPALVGFPGHRLGEILEGGFVAMNRAGVCLSHTDASPGNVIWSDPYAVLIDFEFACITPMDLDLENLCFHLLQDPDDAVRTRLHDLLSEPLADPGSRDRLQAYAVLRDIWRLNMWLDKAARSAEPLADIDSWAPLVRLRQIASGSSWLSVVV
jgi:scyllo-inosamine 4-kinase